MLKKVLGMKYRTLVTEGNLNNQVGVPHTLFRLRSQHEMAVVEIGSNHPREIRSLCDMLEPTHGLITNIGREHLEFFGSVDGVADEEGALFEALGVRSRSVAIVNADDEYVVMKAKRVKRRVTFGFAGRNVAVKGKMIGLDERGCARFQFSGKKRRAVQVKLGVPGEHQAANALAAAAVGLLFNVPATAIADALGSFRPASKRMELLHVGGVWIYNDTYNANPDSTIAAVRTLAAAKVGGKKIAVIADMRELGERGPEEHAQVGVELARLGIDYLLTFGGLAKHIHDAAKLQQAVHYEQKNVLAEYLAELVAPGDAVLVKGSRGTKMEDVVIFLEERLRSAAVHN
jgi:UDP-N-acetylmuramoyl-tripeptide--D-alanyl-D-alanine ligase